MSKTLPANPIHNSSHPSNPPSPSPPPLHPPVQPPTQFAPQTTPRRNPSSSPLPTLTLEKRDTNPLFVTLRDAKSATASHSSPRRNPLIPHHLPAALDANAQSPAIGRARRCYTKGSRSLMPTIRRRQSVAVNISGVWVG